MALNFSEKSKSTLKSVEAPPYTRGVWGGFVIGDLFMHMTADEWKDQKIHARVENPGCNEMLFGCHS